MDSEPEELQFLSILGIFRESSKLLRSSLRLFAQITLTLILPLSLLFLSHVYFSHLIFSSIISDDNALDSSAPNSAAESSALRRLAHDWSSFLLFKSVYLLFLLLLALLSTSAVVYSVASIYTSRDLSSFSKILITVVPKVWRRLAATFLWAFIALLCFNSAALIVFVASLLIAGDSDSGTAVLMFLLLPVYLVGLVYISVVWHLASVVSVLEDVRGLDAMKKARVLIKGKIALSAGIFVLLNLCFVAVEMVFRRVVVVGDGVGAGTRFFVGVIVLVVLCVVVLFALVVQSVVYFVCKSYHHESIDKSSLADHLEVYLGEYVPLTAKDVQLEQFHV